MAASKIGAKIMYCGHDGWFIADIFEVGTANAIKAIGPITGDSLVRGRNDEATHHVTDFPKQGCWAPQRGFLVVSKAQVRVLKKE